MNAYSEDLRKKIVEALRRGTTKSEAARSFGVSRQASTPRAETTDPLEGEIVIEVSLAQEFGNATSMEARNVELVQCFRHEVRDILDATDQDIVPAKVVQYVSIPPGGLVRMSRLFWDYATYRGRISLFTA